ncbi:MAG: hypothetical protein JSS22_06445 [Proteobacteria bacterium]|nr:hypothetical protein [Pseudomonadota bacterium]
MSERSSDQTTGGLGDTSAGMGDVRSSVESPRLAPDQELSAPPPDAIKAEAPPPDAVKAEAPPPDAPKANAPEVEAPKADAPREPGKVMIMAPSRDKSWDGATINPGPAAAADDTHASGLFGKRRLTAIAAIAVLAAIAGAISGSLATSGSSHVAASENAAAASHAKAMETAIARLESEVAALKTGAERSAKGDSGQFAKVNDRLDKVEKAHAESAGKLAKLSETVDKQRVASAPAAPASPAKEATGSVPVAAAAASVPLPTRKPEIARLPTVEGWVLRDVANGGALIEGRQGVYEVYAGDPLPGLGRVDAIRKQDGRWVVVTSRGLIVAR